ncbi:hypothetical protein ThrDRAFT_02254 [Frankia casuarinae]|nr:hypothetical protein ThrDRAFT_02254 [Frankia casuarinae]
MFLGSACLTPGKHGYRVHGKHGYRVHGQSGGPAMTDRPRHLATRYRWQGNPPTSMEPAGSDRCATTASHPTALLKQPAFLKQSASLTHREHGATRRGCPGFPLAASCPGSQMPTSAHGEHNAATTIASGLPGARGWSTRHRRRTGISISWEPRRPRSASAWSGMVLPRAGYIQSRLHPEPATQNQPLRTSRVARRGYPPGIGYGRSTVPSDRRSCGARCGRRRPDGARPPRPSCRG